MKPAARPTLLVAGATGVLGNEVLHRLLGTQRYAATHVLAREPMRAGLAGVHLVMPPGGDVQYWTPATDLADTAVVMFDPPRLFYDRERALWTPAPADLPPLARWLHASGVRTLAVVLPHAQGRLPEALKAGLAGLDEHSVAALGFERVLFVRTARKPEALRGASAPQRLAHWMLSVTQFMVPAREQPVRAVKVAEFVDLALQLAPPGVHVAGPQTVWEAAQGRPADMRQVLGRWLPGPQSTAELGT